MSKQQKIEELAQKLSDLREQKEKLEAEARTAAEKRDKLNEQFKKVRVEIAELKNKRDEINTKVKELKQQRSEARVKADEKIEDAKKLRARLAHLTKEKPEGNISVLQKQIEEIDWKIQTSSLSQPEEKELVAQVKELATQLSAHKKIANAKAKHYVLQAEITAVRSRGEQSHSTLTSNAQKSQEIHQKMLEKIEESRKLKANADELHKQFIQTREKAKTFQDEIMLLIVQIKQLKGEVREDTEKTRKESEGILREKLEKSAKEKLQRGEKLTWDEFKMLRSEDEAQD